MVSVRPTADGRRSSTRRAIEARHRTMEFKKVLDAIDKGVPAGLHVHLVCDNPMTCATPSTRSPTVAGLRTDLSKLRSKPLQSRR
jgi:hypothetical protein